MSAKQLKLTLITESYNLEEGQGCAELEAASAWIAGQVAKRRDCEGLLIDVSDDARVTGIVKRHDPYLRRVALPGGKYDTAKDIGAELAAGDIVVYLDGDCLPDDDAWIDRLVAPIASGQTAATAGLTLYRGGFLAKACSILDFGFLFVGDRAPVDCYASNNVAFTRDLRRAMPVPESDLRCACYKHAQLLMRSGSPIRLSRSAVVHHQLPPLLIERLRRGYDLVAACWNDPELSETAWLANRWINVWRFYASNLRNDINCLRKAPRELNLNALERLAMPSVLAALRLIDVVGIRRGLRVAQDKLQEHADLDLWPESSAETALTKS